MEERSGGGSGGSGGGGGDGSGGDGSGGGGRNEVSLHPRQKWFRPGGDFFIATRKGEGKGRRKEEEELQRSLHGVGACV